MAPKKDSKKRLKKPQFEVGERVLCYHGTLLYEAECVKVSVKYRKIKYLIHYPGGNEKGVVVRTRLSEKLAKMRAQEAQKTEAAHKASKASEVHEASKGSETLEPGEVSVTCEVQEVEPPEAESREAAQVPGEATEAQAAPQIPVVTKGRAARKARRARKARALLAAAQASGAAPKPDETEVPDVRETRMGRLIREARAREAAREAAKAREEAAREAAKAREQAAFKLEGAEEPETHMICDAPAAVAIETAKAQEGPKDFAKLTAAQDEVAMPEATGETCVAANVAEAARGTTSAQEGARASGASKAKSCEILEVSEIHRAHIICEVHEVIEEDTEAATGASEPSETIEVCEVVETSDIFKASRSHDAHAATETASASEADKSSETGQTSVSCEMTDTSSTATKVSAASEEKLGAKSKVKKKRRGKAKAKAEIQYPPDDFDSKDVICLTTGWDDEWVPESRLLKYSEANLQKQKELFQAHQELYARGKEKGGASGKGTSESAQKKPAESAETPSASAQADSGGSSRSRDGASTSDNQPPRWRRRPLSSSEGGEAPRPGLARRHDFKINIPQELKPWLVNDWNLVTVQKKLFSLPARKTVESILEDYELYEKTYATTEDKIYAVPEIVAGIRAYFNLMLSSHLLYKFEKPQHAALIASDPTTVVSQVYGAPHLLRLFVKIGDMLSYAFFDSHSTNLLLRYLHDFVKYLADNSAALFTSNDYEPASPEYLLKAGEEPEQTPRAGSSK